MSGLSDAYKVRQNATQCVLPLPLVILIQAIRRPEFMLSGLPNGIHFESLSQFVKFGDISLGEFHYVCHTFAGTRKSI